MVRSAAAVLALLILPGFAFGQEPVGTHTVVKDDTLWDLAQRYYSNPFEWRVIWNANRDVIDDPNWIYPAEVVVIPGLPGDATPMAASTGAAPVEADPVADEVPADLVPFGLRQARPITEGARTVFYNDTAMARQSVEASRSLSYVPVSPDAAYSAPWVIGLGTQPERTGIIEGFADSNSRGSSIRSFDEVRISMPSPARVGARLQLFRVAATIEDVGVVVRPTGIATVSTIGNGEVVAMISQEYSRIQPGDLARPLPMYQPVAGNYAEPVAGGSEAMIIGFAGRQVLTDIGHVAFLDLGSDDGIVIGDEFVLYGEAVPTNEDGALQVIGVTETTAAARVLSMADNVFRPGIVVRLAKKMR